MKLPVAIQVYSLRDEASADFEGTLAKIKELGYDGVEFAGLYGHTAEEVRDLCKKYDLNPISAHVPFFDMLKNPDGLFAQYAAIGCKYVAIPSISAEWRPGTTNFDCYAFDIIAMLGKAAKKAGIQLLYHNHDFEFTKVNGEYGLDLIYANIPSALLKTEIDTCWANVGGVNPAEYVLKYSGRAPVVHLKDFFGKKTDDMYELIGVENKAPARPEGFEYRPVGYGLQDIPSIIKASKEAGAEWLIVEQDKASMGLTPMECAAKSIEYLRSIGQ